LRPYLLVSSSAIASISEAAAQMLQRWAAAWGATSDGLTVDVMRLEEASAPAPTDDWQGSHGGWLWKSSSLIDSVAAAVALPAAGSPGDADSISAQCVKQAADDLTAGTIAVAHFDILRLLNQEEQIRRWPAGRASGPGPGRVWQTW